MPNQRKPGIVVQSVPIPADLRRRAKLFAEREGTSLAAVARAALIEYLDKHESSPQPGG